MLLSCQIFYFVVALNSLMFLFRYQYFLKTKFRHQMADLCYQQMVKFLGIQKFLEPLGMDFSDD